MRARNLGLSLPVGFNPRTLALGQQWRQRYGSDDAAIVQAALTLFHDGGFRYTLTPAPLGRDAMDDFLFNTREGFWQSITPRRLPCWMRDAGIPARVVTGYQGGYWSKYGNYLLVRYLRCLACLERGVAGRAWLGTC